MSDLKLLALDHEDLQVISAHAQDSVLLVGDIKLEPNAKRLILPINRFVWEQKQGIFKRGFERRRAVLHFERVLNARSVNIDRSKRDQVLNLLAVEFEERDNPAGTISLIFSDHATLSFDVECIEARLTDLGAAWQTKSRPTH